MLITARVVRGAAGAMVSPAAPSLLTTMNPEGPARNRALAIWPATTAAGATGIIAGGQPRTLSGKPADLPEHTDGRLRKYLLPCLQRPVGIAAVLDAQDDDFAKVFPDAVKDPIGSPAR